MQIHVARDGKELGVFSVEEINRQLAAGTLRVTDQAWYDGAAGWAELLTVPGVSAAPASATAPSPATPAAPTAAVAAPAVMVPRRKNEPLATVSLMASLFGLSGFCCGLFLTAAIAGVVCGHLALSRIKANPELGGRGMALAGVVIGYVSIAGWLIWTLAFGGVAILQGITESMTKH